MSFFTNLFSSPPALGIEHLFGVHSFDPGSNPNNQLAPQAQAASNSGLNLGQFNGIVGHGPPRSAPTPMPTNQPPRPMPSPTMAPSPMATPAMNPYQAYLQGLQVQPSPGLPTPPPDLRQAVQRVSREQGLPPALLYGISGAEAVHPKNNQWLNTTGDDHHGQGYFQIDDRYFPPSPTFNPNDPYQAATHAAQQFKGDVNYFQQHPTNGYSPIEGAMRAYNAGRGGHLDGPIPTQDYNRFQNYTYLNR